MNVRNRPLCRVARAFADAVRSTCSAYHASALQASTPCLNPSTLRSAHQWRRHRSRCSVDSTRVHWHSRAEPAPHETVFTKCRFPRAMNASSSNALQLMAAESTRPAPALTGTLDRTARSSRIDAADGCQSAAAHRGLPGPPRSHPAWGRSQRDRRVHWENPGSLAESACSSSVLDSARGAPNAHSCKVFVGVRF